MNVNGMSELQNVPEVQIAPNAIPMHQLCYVNRLVTLFNPSWHILSPKIIVWDA